jgi:hypothetical protein
MSRVRNSPTDICCAPAHGGRTYLKPRWNTDCALELSVLEFFHRIHSESRVCVGEEGRGLTIARDRQTTIMSQMNAYLLFLKAWELECSGDETRLRLITNFHAGRR